MQSGIIQEQPKDPTVAAILINYNGIAMTREAIRSLQSSKIPVRILVVDNASAKNEGKRIEEACPEVTVLQSPENLGFAGGNNLGIRYALAQGYTYVLLINNDTIAAADMVGELLRRAGPDTVTAPVIYRYDIPDTISFGGGKIVRWKGGIKHLLENTRDPAVFSRESRESSRVFSPENTAAQDTAEAPDVCQLAKSTDNQIIKNRTPRACTFLTGCCMMIHRDVLEIVGLMDESYFMYSEDVDFCIRLLQHHIKMLVVPSARLWHRIGSSSGGDNTVFTAYYGTRNRIALIKKHRKFFKKFTLTVFLLSRQAKRLRYAVKHSPCAKAVTWGIEDARKGITGRSTRDLSGAGG